MAPKPNLEQTKWLNENYNRVRNCDIAAKFNISINNVVSWLNFLGLKKERRVYAGRKSNAKEKRKYVNKPIERLSSEYSNVTREQHVERWLNA
jgi:uncharacterized protein YjcR